MNLSAVVEKELLETVDGQVRVAGTRIPLDTVVATFKDGATAEEIVRRYPALPLADVYYVIGYYLQHQQETEEYLAGQHKMSLKIRKENEARFAQQGIRERLLARQNKKE